MKKQEAKRQAPGLHKRNKHQGKYDFEALVEVSPELSEHLRKNPKGEDTIDFANAESVKALNLALLKLQYGISHWDIPKGYLTPPIPGRADYIHHMAQWLSRDNSGKLAEGPKIKCLDIGTGASLIYPIIGVSEYDWTFVASDIDPTSIESAQNIIDQNSHLKERVELRIQKEPADTLYGILQPKDRFDLVICNPPFHGSAEEAMEASTRKVRNLTGKNIKQPKLNFAGMPNELWCEGGEVQFIQNYVRQSSKFAKSCFWYSTLVSKDANVKSVYQALSKYQPEQVQSIQMGQGNKVSRLVTWTFLTLEQQKQWRLNRWK
ncbi:MAG: 23S rRNA (adenine(1618)-N(6))-methyltransferase RlmF [Flammeovirgaceae bacterium]|nr:23S rRNA (adenine(1618)-N(6))-methyltransferase RlmF [Flammeovirgaceae bacterium]HCX20989.1 23S rRNA (adenine(1618)-N(6))-methyltransferase RlmF [Cytophagales bacterium]